MCAACGLAKCLIVAQPYKYQTKNYHHGAFVGNDCLKMLKNVDSLQQIAEMHNIHVIQKYVHVLRSLYNVVVICLEWFWIKNIT